MKVTIEDMRGLWEDYINRYASLPDDVKDLSFRMYLGTMLKNHTIYAQMRRISPREHAFLVMPTRSGKGMVMNALHYAVTAGGKSSLQVPGELTPQSMIGQIKRTSGKDGTIKSEEQLEGYLGTYDLIAWDEGRNILEVRNTHGNLKDVILAATDEPGKVMSTARVGTFQTGVNKGKPLLYHTKSSLMTGTINIQSISQEFLSSGLLQRFLVYHDKKQVTDYEKMRASIDDIEISNKERIDKFHRDNPDHSKSKWNDMLVGERNDLVNMFKSAEMNKFVTIDQVEYKRFIREQREPAFKKIESSLPKSGPQLESMEGFITAGSYSHLFKLAGQKALLEGRNKIGYDDFLSGFDVVLKSLYSTLSLIGTRSIQTVDESTARRVEVLLRIMKTKDMMIQSELLQKLNFEKLQNNWDLGTNYSLKFLNKCVEENILMRQKQGNKVFYKIVEHLPKK